MLKLLVKFLDCRLGPICCQLATSIEVGYITKSGGKVGSQQSVMQTQNSLLDRTKLGGSSSGSSNTDNISWVKLKLTDEFFSVSSKTHLRSKSVAKT